MDVRHINIGIDFDPKLCLCAWLLGRGQFKPIHDWDCTYQCFGLKLDCLPLSRWIPWWSWPAPGPPCLWCWNWFLWCCALFVACVHGWERVVCSVPCIFLHGSLLSPLCTPHHRLCDCTGSCRLPHFYCPLGPDPWVSWGLAWLLCCPWSKFVFHTYRMFLKLSARSCVYGMTTYPTVDLGLEVVVGAVLALWLPFSCTWLLLSPVCVCCSILLLLASSWLLFKTLLFTLLMAQWGYLHLTKAFLRCWSSFWRSSRPV